MDRKMKDSGVDWIGEIPEDWEIGRLKNVCSINGRIGFRGYTQDDIVDKGEGAISLSPSNISDSSMTYEKCTYISWKKYDESPEIKISDEDIVMVKTGSSYGKCMMVKNLPQQATINPQLVVIRNKEIENKYLEFVLQSAVIQHQIETVVSGGTIPTMTQHDMYNFYLPIPTREIQKRISLILFQKISAINKTKEDIMVSIDKYKSLKKSLITRAVTKGVRGKRDMKDSGIEWVKEIPCEWDSINPKALFKQRKDRAKEGEKQLTASQKYGVIYQDDYMELTGSSVVLVEKDFSILKHVEAGDFVISMRSFQGGLEYSENTGAISSAYVMLIPNKEMVYPPFYKWLFKSSLYINALQSTSDLVRDGQAMRYSNFAKVRLYCVPINEQREIAAYLDEKCSAIDTLIAKKEQLLSELETYKKSLIYEYVTGKREVPA